MSAVKKRYYWLKLHERFFAEESIEFIEQFPDSDSILVIYLKLLLRSLATGGYICTGWLYPTLEENIALMVKRDAETTKRALSVLEQANLIEVGVTDGDLYLKELPAMVGSETDSAGRMRRSRDRKKESGSVTLLHPGDASVTAGDTSVTACCTDKEIEKDKEKEIDKREEKIEDKKISPSFCGVCRNVCLSDAEYADLKERFPDYRNKIDNLSRYMASTGKRYESHYQTILLWAARDAGQKGRNASGGFEDYSLGGYESL